jgi:hypothetical protein
MRYRRGAVALVVATSLVVGAGCHGKGHRGGLAATEPPLDVAAGGDGAPVVVASPRSSPAWVDNNPIFSKPREYYANTDSNVIVKGAAATFVGVPAGIAGQVKKMVTRKPQPSAIDEVPY